MSADASGPDGTSAPDSPWSDGLRDVSMFRGVLTAAGLGQGAVDGAVARLTEVQQLGRIDGSGWPGQIVDANQVMLR